MDGNFDEQKKEVPAPPAPEISIRTMDSDIKALEQGGGEMAAPQTFVQPQENQENKFEVAGYAGPEKPIFSSMSGILPKEDSNAPAVEKSSWIKSVLIIIAIVAGVVTVGFFGYFVFSNWIFPAQMPAV
ncbi:MAG: hypothetical protein WC461_01190 [Candidatus Paceibacterota bacterium]